MLELRDAFRKLQDMKSMHKMQLHFYITVKTAKTKIRKTVPLTLTSKRANCQHLGINLVKKVNNLYAEDESN